MGATWIKAPIQTECVAIPSENVMVESINWVVCLSMDDLYLMWYGNELLSLLIMV